MQEILLKTLMTIISFVVTGALGYFVGKVKEYKKRIKDKDEEGKLLKTALISMLQNYLTNTYYVYENVEKIPDYVYKNWINMYIIYEQLGGNDYVHILADKMKKWDFEKTDILRGK